MKKTLEKEQQFKRASVRVFEKMKSKNLETKIKKYILMGFNAEGVKEKKAIIQTDIVWDCIEPVIYQAFSQEFSKSAKKIEKNIVNQLPVFPSKEMINKMKFWLKIIQKAIKKALGEERRDENT